jgi:hypothetical protein
VEKCGYFCNARLQRKLATEACMMNCQIRVRVCFSASMLTCLLQKVNKYLPAMCTSAPAQCKTYVRRGKVAARGQKAAKTYETETRRVDKGCRSEATAIDKTTTIFPARLSLYRP